MFIMRTLILNFMAVFLIGTAMPAMAFATGDGLVATNTHGPVEVIIIAEPARVRLDNDLLLTLRIRAPETVEVGPPSVEQRLTGFSVAGMFARIADAAEGVQVTEYVFRLTPFISDEYRLGPLAVGYLPANDDAETTWMFTKPLNFQPPLIGDAHVSDIIGPRRLMPSWRVMASWLAWLLGVAILIGLAGLLFRRLRLAWRLHRMSPRQRAMYELNRLLESGLRDAGRHKEFYAELAMVVRRYIERAHAIRAPEQTTEEFLSVVAADARFRPLVLASLRDFLQTADLVKFAAWQPDQAVAQRAVQTARDYITKDDSRRCPPQADQPAADSEKVFNNGRIDSRKDAKIAKEVR